MQDLADFKLQCIFTVPELLICPTLRFFFFLLHWTCFTAAPSRCLVEEQQWKREINNMNPAECGRTYPGIQGARVLSVTWAQPTAEPSKAPPSQLYVCVCGCKGAQQWLEHVLTFILRNCARSPPKTTTSLLVFLCVCRSRTSSESGSKAKRCFEVVWKCVFQILSEIWGLPLGTLEYQSPRWSLLGNWRGK